MAFPVLIDLLLLKHFKQCINYPGWKENNGRQSQHCYTSIIYRSKDVFHLCEPLHEHAEIFAHADKDPSSLVCAHLTSPHPT